MSSDKKNIYDIVVFEGYTDRNGTKKSKAYQVGAAFESKDSKALNCVVPDGISLSGRFTILPRKEKAADDGTSHDAPEDAIPFQ